MGDLKCSPIDGVVALPNICLSYTIHIFNKSIPIQNYIKYFYDNLYSDIIFMTRANT